MSKYGLYNYYKPKKIMPPPLGGSKLKSCFCVPTSLCALIKGGVGVRGPVPPPPF